MDGSVNLNDYRQGLKVLPVKQVVRGIPADFADYNPATWMGWSTSFQDYNHATSHYEQAGMYFLELAIKLKWGMIPSTQTIPVVRLASSIMPDHSFDVLAYAPATRWDASTSSARGRAIRRAWSASAPGI